MQIALLPTFLPPLPPSLHNYDGRARWVNPSRNDMPGLMAIRRLGDGSRVGMNYEDPRAKFAVSGARKKEWEEGRIVMSMHVYLWLA